MRNFLRSPLTWMVVAEFIVVGVLVVVAWTAVTAATRPALASPINQLPDSSSDSSALPDLPVLTPRCPRPFAGAQPRQPVLADTAGRAEPRPGSSRPARMADRPQRHGRDGALPRNGRAARGPASREERRLRDVELASPFRPTS